MEGAFATSFFTEQEQAKAQRLQAYKDFHEDGTQDVSREQAKERGAFADADYARTYSRLSYAEKAKDLSEDIHQHTQTMMDDPTIGIATFEIRFLHFSLSQSSLTLSVRAFHSFFEI